MDVRVGAEHVVVGEQVAEAERLHRLRVGLRTLAADPPSSVCGNTTPICIPRFYRPRRRIRGLRQVKAMIPMIPIKTTAATMTAMIP